MKCVNPKVGKLLARYELKLLSAEEKSSFESHLLQCDFCYQEYDSFSSVIAVMSEERAALKEALAQKSGAKPFVILDGLRSLAQLVTQLPNRLPSIRPAWGLAAAAFLLLMFFIWLPLPPNYRDWAVMAPAEYQPFEVVLRGGPAAQDWKTLFDEGMAFYSEGNYSAAITKLSQSYALNPSDASVQFYLGVSWLLTEAPDSAIVYLQKAVDAGDVKLAESAHWFLGNAYLLNENPRRAAERFQWVLTFDGRYKDQAFDLLSRISQGEDRPQLLKALQHLKKNLKEILD